MDTALARHLLALVREDPAVERIVDSGFPSGASIDDGAGTGAVDVVLTAPGAGPDRDGSRLGGVDTDGAARLLERLDHLPIRSLVVVSSAMVYGAWPANPVPISEDAALRPNPECSYAMDRAELERRAAEFVRRHPDVLLIIVRPTLTIAGDSEAVDWLERSLWHDSSVRSGDGGPPGQFLLLEDLARAIEHLRRAQLPGVFNVAPEGWLTARRQVELNGTAERGSWPATAVAAVVEARWLLQATSTPPEMLAYVRHPWVVATDRLRSTGWEASATNDQAYVLGSRPGMWSSLTGRRRQEVSLAAMVAVLIGLVGVAVSSLRRRARRVAAGDDRSG